MTPLPVRVPHLLEQAVQVRIVQGARHHRHRRQLQAVHERWSSQ
jgi:hypothetical protein